MAEQVLDDLRSPAHADSSEANAVTALNLVLEGDADALRVLWLQEPSHIATVRVNARSRTSGRALLHEACAEGRLEVVKLLLEKLKADIMLRTMLVRSRREGGTSEGCWFVSKRRLTLTIPSTRQGQCTPLHLAVAKNHRSVVFLLLSYGADPLCRDRSGSSPMHYVKSISVAKLLIQYGGLVLDYNAVRLHSGSSRLFSQREDG